MLTLYPVLFRAGGETFRSDSETAARFSEMVQDEAKEKQKGGSANRLLSGRGSLLAKGDCFPRGHGIKACLHWLDMVSGHRSWPVK